MTTQIHLDGGQPLIITPGSIRASGRVSPVLMISFEVSMAGAAGLRLDHLIVRLRAAGELIGTGQLVGGAVYGMAGSMQVEIPTTHRMLEFITDRLGAGPHVDLEIRVQGRLRWRADSADPDWQDAAILNDPAVPLAVSRTTWYQLVLAPVRQSEYVYLEVAIPNGDPGDRGAGLSSSFTVPRPLTRPGTTTPSSSGSAGSWTRFPAPSSTSSTWFPTRRNEAPSTS